MDFLPLNEITKRQCVRMPKMNFEILLIGRSCSCYRFIANQNVKFNTYRYFKWKIYYHRWWTFNADTKSRKIIFSWIICCWLQYNWMSRKRCLTFYEFSSKFLIRKPGKIYGLIQVHYTFASQLVLPLVMVIPPHQLWTDDYYLYSMLCLVFASAEQWLEKLEY